MMRPVVTREQMEALIAKYPPVGDDSADAPPGQNGARAGKSGKITDVRAYLEEHHIEIRSEKIGPKGETVYVLKQCVFDSSHTTGAAVLQWPKGTIGYKCFHQSCQDKKWADVRDAVEGSGWRLLSAGEAKRLLAYVKPILDAPGSEVFHDAGGEAHATVPVREHHETLPIRSRAMRLWVGRVFYQWEKQNPTPQAVQQLLGGLEARALYDGPSHDVFLRLAQPARYTIWLDLGAEDHRAVQITADGWRVVTDPPVKFLRKKGMLPLPEPIRPENGETLESLLRPFINVARPKVVNQATGETDDSAWVLYVTWLCSTFWPTGPFPILQLHGEQGSAKSTVADVSQGLVDPNEADRNGEPRELRDLAIAARNSWLLPFDNVRYVQPWLSDTLCRMSTGGGYRTRQLYSDDEEAIFKYKRPVLLTGVSEVVVAPDLLDRTISLRLEVIGGERRKSEEAFKTDFAEKRAAILGAVLTVISEALRVLPDIKQVNLPRMADFSVRSQAVEKAMGWPVGTFAKAYEGTRREAREVALEASAIYAEFVEWLNARRRIPGEQRHEWTGNMDTLLKELNHHRELTSTSEHPRAPKGWPGSPRGLSGMLDSIRSHLRQVGIEIERRPHRVYCIIDARPYEAIDRDEPPATPAARSDPIGMRNVDVDDTDTDDTEEVEGETDAASDVES